MATSAGLSDYPLRPYLRYQWLKDKLAQTDQVLAFLATYKDSRYAGLLRSKWLDYLAEHERWSEFVQHHVEDENSSDDCQYQWAKYKTGKHQAAFTEAKRLWLLGEPADKDCALPLFRLAKFRPYYAGLSLATVPGGNQ